jgi:hypothetical protein
MATVAATLHTSSLARVLLREGPQALLAEVSRRLRRWLAPLRTDDARPPEDSEPEEPRRDRTTRSPHTVDNQGRDLSTPEGLRALVVDRRGDQADPDTGLLPTAMTMSYIPEMFEGKNVRLLSWASLAPWGPSIFDLTLLPVETRDVFLLGTVRQHPLDRVFAIVGVLPRAVARDLDAVTLVAERLIADDGIPGHVLWPHALPTNVALHRALLPDLQVRELVFSLVRRRYDASLVRQAVADHRAHWLDPWARAEAQIRRTAEGRGAHRLIRRGEPDRDLLMEWWQIVTNPDHIRVEAGELEPAWEGRMAVPHHAVPHRHTGPEAA